MDYHKPTGCFVLIYIVLMSFQTFLLFFLPFYMAKHFPITNSHLLTLTPRGVPCVKWSSVQDGYFHHC